MEVKKGESIIYDLKQNLDFIIVVIFLAVSIVFNISLCVCIIKQGIRISKYKKTRSRRNCSASQQNEYIPLKAQRRISGEIIHTPSIISLPNKHQYQQCYKSKSLDMQTIKNYNQQLAQSSNNGYLGNDIVYVPMPSRAMTPSSQVMGMIPLRSNGGCVLNWDMNDIGCQPSQSSSGHTKTTIENALQTNQSASSDNNRIDQENVTQTTDKDELNDEDKSHEFAPIPQTSFKCAIQQKTIEDSMNISD